jgi:hypothetical protein
LLLNTPISEPCREFLPKKRPTLPEAARVFGIDFISRRDADADGLAIYSRPMFDIVRPQIATAADKVSHLRRFL